MTALTTEIGSLYNLIRPCTSAWQLWANTLVAGVYSSGSSVLRDGDNAYDPMGVLAAIQDTDWTWDDREEAWACEGHIYTLPPARIALWLGVTHRVHDQHLNNLQAVLQKAADNGATLPSIGACLLEGQAFAEREKHRLDSVRTRSAAPCGVVGAVSYHDNSFYGRLR